MIELHHAVRVGRHRDGYEFGVPVLEDARLDALPDSVHPELVDPGLHPFDVGGQSVHTQMVDPGVHDAVPARMLDHEVQISLSRTDETVERRRLVQRSVEVPGERPVSFPEHFAQDLFTAFKVSIDRRCRNAKVPCQLSHGKPVQPDLEIQFASAGENPFTLTIHVNTVNKAPEQVNGELPYGDYTV